MTTHTQRGTVVALGGAYAALLVAGANDPLLAISRSLTAWLLTTFGANVAATADALTLGPLIVPWTADCSALNLLGLLWAVTLWTRRNRPLAQAWPWLLLAVPAAILANSGRVLTVIAYRAAFFPEVESLQLHYFLSFVWVLPFLGPFTGLRWRRHRRGLLEAVYFASVLCLLAPFMSAPGGAVMACSVLLLLARGGLDAGAPPRALAVTAWLLAGLATAAAGMESLWMPWLLVCPWFMPKSALRSAHGLILLAGTVSLVAMQPVAAVVIALAGVWQARCLWKEWTRSEPGEVPARQTPPAESMSMWHVAAVGLITVYPFLAMAASAPRGASTVPPAGVMRDAIGGANYRLRLVAQPRDLYLDWFPPSGDGRHHTLSVCMRFRGVTLRETGEPHVLSDGKAWMREFFVVDQQLLTRYQDYIWRTFVPLAPAGIHLVVSAPSSSMASGEFSAAAERLARDYIRTAGAHGAITRLGSGSGDKLF